MTIFDRIKELADEKGLSIIKLQQMAGLSKGAIQQWKDNKHAPSIENLTKVAKTLNVSVEYLTGDSQYRNQNDMINHFMQTTDQDELARTSTMIPVQDIVRAGIPNHELDMPSPEDVLDYVPYPENAHGKLYACKIKGNSMSPRIQDGDVVIFRLQPDAENGDIVIAKVNGDDACCKRLIKNKDTITLQSLNPDYAPMTFNRDEIDQKPVTIIGKVIQFIGKL